MQSIIKKYHYLRRIFLRNFVPEFIWPNQISLDGISIPIRNMPFSFGTKRGLIKGQYELAERKLLPNRLKPGDIVIEMGGSIGILTAILSNYVGSNGKVLSVEASKKLTDDSKKWLEQKGNVKVLTGFGFPVFSISENIRINKFSEEGGSLGGTVSFEVMEKNEKEKANFEIWDIGKISSTYGVEPTVLVLDIEGSEIILVDQKANFPASIRMILIELHPWMYDDKCKNNIINMVISEGFILKEIITTSYLFERD